MNKGIWQRTPHLQKLSLIFDLKFDGVSYLVSHLVRIKQALLTRKKGAWCTNEHVFCEAEMHFSYVPVFMVEICVGFLTNLPSRILQNAVPKEAHILFCLKLLNRLRATFPSPFVHLVMLRTQPIITQWYLSFLSCLGKYIVTRG